MIQNWKRTSLAAALAFATVVGCSLTGMAAGTTSSTVGEVSINGQVTINGTAITSGTSFFSGSTLSTGNESVAVVDLGKVGRVEVQPNTTVKLNFTDQSLNSGLEEGQVLVAAAPGVISNVNTKAGVVTGDQTAGAAYTVDAFQTQTEVTPVAGKATLGGKTVSTGDTATAGQLPAGAQRQPRTAGSRSIFGNLSGAKLATLLAAIAGSIIIVVLAIRNSRDDLGTGGGTPIVISPTR